MTQYETLTIDVAEQICTITLNRPDSLNAMNPTIVEETALAFEAANRDDNTKVILFTGAGRAFCAGDDRNEHVHPENIEQAIEFVNAIQRVTEAIVNGDKLVVGAINGWAVGGGFEWAINCDFPLWSQSARGFFPEVSLNLFVTGGVTSMLPALVGLNKAREMLILGERYDAATLLDLGVAWRVVEDDQLLNEARKVALKLASLPALSSRAMKRVLNQTAMAPLKQAMELETAATVTGFMDPETTRLLKDF